MKRRRAAVGAIGATLLLFAATACASESSDSTEASEPAAGGADPAPTAPPAGVPEALQFSAPLVGGGTFDGAATAGKPTVFWFWAPT